MRSWRSIVTISALVTALLAFGLATAAEPGGPCRDDGEGRIVCGSGPGALRVIPGTTSPSGELAVAWRASGTLPSEEPDPDAVENHVVRLGDGRSLLRLESRHWEGDATRANHSYLRMVWSPDSRYLLALASGKWLLERAALYAFGGEADVAGPLDVLGPLKEASRRILEAAGRANAEAYALDVLESPPPAVGSDGAVTIGGLLQIPKGEEEELDFLLRFRVQAGAGGLSAEMLEATPIEPPD